MNTYDFCFITTRLLKLPEITIQNTSQRKPELRRRYIGFRTRGGTGMGRKLAKVVKYLLKLGDFWCLWICGISGPLASRSLGPLAAWLQF